MINKILEGNFWMQHIKIHRGLVSVYWQKWIISIQYKPAIRIQGFQYYRLDICPRTNKFGDGVLIAVLPKIN